MSGLAGSANADETATDWFVKDAAAASSRRTATPQFGFGPMHLLVGRDCWCSAYSVTARKDAVSARAAWASVSALVLVEPFGSGHAPTAPAPHGGVCRRRGAAEPDGPRRCWCREVAVLQFADELADDLSPTRSGTSRTAARLGGWCGAHVLVSTGFLGEFVAVGRGRRAALRFPLGPGSALRSRQRKTASARGAVSHRLLAFVRLDDSAFPGAVARASASSLAQAALMSLLGLSSCHSSCCVRGRHRPELSSASHVRNGPSMQLYPCSGAVSLRGSRSSPSGASQINGQITQRRSQRLSASVDRVDRSLPQ